MLRRQLPVASPISLTGLLRGAKYAFSDATSQYANISRQLLQRFNGRAVALTDSGTSALALAIQLATGRSKSDKPVVALPAYACADLITASKQADVQIRLYDIVPQTLSPDLDSLREIASLGIDAIVVAHFFGFAADMYGVREIADEYGVSVIEDAAQQAGASIDGQPLGSFGDLTILSFGRGKGTTAGSGGALLGIGEGWEVLVEETANSLPPPDAGLRNLVVTVASWVLGRPGLYALPSSIPQLKLGETVYHEPHPPQSLTRTAVGLLQSSLESIDRYTGIRRANASELNLAAQESARLIPTKSLDGASSGYLRFPILTRRSVDIAPELGIVRGYPKALSEYQEIQELLIKSDHLLPGARTLVSGLITLPTHHLLNQRDIKQLQRWLRMA